MTNEDQMTDPHEALARNESISVGIMRTSLIAPFVLMAALAGAGPETKAASIFESDAELTPEREIDKLVLDRLQQLGIQPARVCSDEVFVRRVYLDVIGTLPTSDKAREFLQDQDPQKRRALIDRLLEREEFADYWSMKWGDVLRIKAEFPINLWPNAVQAYHRWVRTSIVENKPYDQFARELLTSSGSNFRMGPVNFYRAVQNRTPEGIATVVALTFMGARAKSWSPERLSGMASFFSQIGYKPTAEWKEESVFWDALKSSALATSIAPGQSEIRTSLRPTESDSKSSESDEKTPLAFDAGPLVGIFPDGTRIELPPDRDPREVFADWLITAENPWFGRSIVNRVWAWLMGRGIVHEPDDIRDDNPPANPELLAYLEKELIDNDYDLKHLYRLILNSRTYQLSAITRSDRPEAKANFASYPLRRLEAEILIDALNKITGTSELYTSAIPEPFTYIPKDQPAIALADGSVTSKFLTLFGRSARATGMENERKNKLGPAQWLHMINSIHIQSKLEQSPALQGLAGTETSRQRPSKETTPKRSPEEIAKELYLTVLSRWPTQEELRVVSKYFESSASERDAAVDIIWALINSTEFLYRH